MMSETISTPHTPDIAGPAGSAPAAPPPAEAPGGPLTVTDAARLLGKRRAEARNEAPDAPAAAKPAPDGEKTGTESKVDISDAMAKAFGLENAPDSPDSTPTEGQIQFEGRSYTPKELKSLISAGFDYTKKTQQLSEKARMLEAQEQLLAQVIPLIQPEIIQLQQRLAEVQPPDEALLETDEKRYHRERAAYERAMAERQRMMTLQAVQTEAQERAAKEAVAAANAELAREFDFWREPETRKQAQDAIVTWALDKGGYSRDELRGLTSARELKNMMKAMQFDRFVGGLNTKAPQPRYTTPVRGAAPPPAPAETQQRAEAAFEAKPSIRTGAALLAARRASAPNDNGRY